MNAIRSLSLDIPLVACLVLACVTTVHAQDDRPGPATPVRTEIRRPGDQASAQDPDGPTSGDGFRTNNRDSRRDLPEGKIKLAFKDEAVDEKLFAWIAEQTGKIVMPVQASMFQNVKITLLNDEWIERADAFDMLVRALRLNNVGVIEKDDAIIIGNLDTIVPLRQMDVLRAGDDVMGRHDKGSLIVKIFRLKEASAEEVGERIGENLPSFASISIDPNSNQIMLIGDVALAQHLQEIINELDRNHVQVRTQTFRLAYADAQDVADSILDLFEVDANANQARQARQIQRGRPQPQQTPGIPGAVVELKVTVNSQQNSVTVSGEPSSIEQIAQLIYDEWDRPRPVGTSKIYQLVYTDPIKVADKINSLLGGGGSTPNRNTRQTGGPGAGGSVEAALSGIYKIEPFPDGNQLFVFSKTEQSLDFLDNFIEMVDQPSYIGLPFVIELYHANAIELSEELNALLSEAGAQATIQRPEQGLEGRSDDPSTGGATAANANQGGGSASGTISFPWQRGGPGTEEQAPESSLIGNIRIVPVVRQNALAVLCPPSQRQAMEEIISSFDRPGRQVMISAIIAEVELTDDLAFGLRFSNSDSILSGGNPDNRVGGTIGITGTSTDPFNLFDTSSLDLNTSVNVALQALAQKTNVKIIQEPLVFTADNQEAIFFDGQDIPFITNTTINAQGNPTDSFEYREVGVTLNVRPRITAQKDVDLEVNLTLSSIVPGQTLFGGAIIDRRETSTHIIVRNNQTIVISGILRDVESKIKRGMPILSDIPLIGNLFSSHENSTTTTELVAFITPQVVDNPSENDENFQREYRQRLQGLNRPIEELSRERRMDPEIWRRKLDGYPGTGQSSEPMNGSYENEPMQDALMDDIDNIRNADPDEGKP